MNKKICPIMSRFVSVSFNDECPAVRVAEFNEKECLREDCAFWVITSTDHFCGVLLK